MSHSNAPWTADQVASLNGYQHGGYGHPFTGARKPNGDETVLIATPDGWIEHEGGPVTQTWAHLFMVDWTWKQRADKFAQAMGIAEEDTDPGS